MEKANKKLISLRLSEELYQKFVDEAISRSTKEKKIIHVSEIIRDILEKPG